MNPNTLKLNRAGVSIWLDNITRRMLGDGTLSRYIGEYSVTGLTSNPSIFEAAIAGTGDYDLAIRELSNDGLSDEQLFFILAAEDIRQAADLFLPVYRRTNGLDGFVSIEVSPLLAYDTESTIHAAREIHTLVGRPNVFIKIPGTPEGLPAIEAVVAEGIPVNVTLLFSAAQYEAAALAWLRGAESRLERGLNPDVRSVASVFVSRWDRAVAGKVPPELHNRLGLAVMELTREACGKFLGSERVRRLSNAGVFPQRLLWASTGTKDPSASDVLYVENLVVPYTVNTIPENTLLAFADHGRVPESNGGSPAEALSVIRRIEACGFNYDGLAESLQKEGAESFNKSWNNLIRSISQKRSTL